MIRSVWLAISTLAVANLLALVGFLLWLNSTDRLSEDRVRAVRAIFAQTISEEAAAAKAEAAAIERARLEQEAADRLAVPPEAAASRVARGEVEEQVEFQRLLRQQREIDDLRRGLQRDRAEIIAREAKLAEERQAFEEYRKRLTETEGAAQFRRALATLQAQRPRDAKVVLQQMLDSGKSEEVVSYLSAMEPRVRGKVMAEFVKDGPVVAASLLEKLRTRGMTPPGAETQAR